MAHILEYSNYEILPTEEALLIKPIRDLYYADTSEDKETFLTQMSIIYFLVDPRSSFSYILDEEERLHTILIENGLPTEFELTKELQSAIDAYRQHTVTIASQILDTTKRTVDKIRKFLNDVDLTEEDDKGRPKYPIEKVISALNQVDKLVTILVETEKKVTREIEEKGRARGNQGQKTLMDDGIIK